MPPRTGRPPAENPKDKRVQFRLDQEYLQKLEECAARENKSKSEVIRMGIDLMYSKGENNE